MGYDLERFVGYVNEGLLCCICRDVLEDPLQTPCEHAFCSTCIRGWLVHHNNCPEDRLPLDISLLRPLSRYMRNDLSRLQVRCMYRPQGCEFIGTLEMIHRHEEQCDFALLNCTNGGCPVQVSRRSLEAHLCVCVYSSRICARGCGYTILNTEEGQHNCVSELRAELDLLRAELNCKVEEMKHEMESRLDSQRRHMVQKESLLRSEMDELKGQLSCVMSDVRVLLASERARRQELERVELEKAELLELLKNKGLRPATLPESETAQAEGSKRLSPRSLALECIKRRNREVTVI